MYHHTSVPINRTSPISFPFALASELDNAKEPGGRLAARFPFPFSAFYPNMFFLAACTALTSSVASMP